MSLCTFFHPPLTFCSLCPISSRHHHCSNESNHKEASKCLKNFFYSLFHFPGKRVSIIENKFYNNRCCTLLYHLTSYIIYHMSCRVVSCRVVLCSVILCYVICYILYYIILYCIILYYIILYYIILYYIILYYIILYCLKQVHVTSSGF